MVGNKITYWFIIRQKTMCQGTKRASTYFWSPCAITGHPVQPVLCCPATEQLLQYFEEIKSDLSTPPKGKTLYRSTTNYSKQKLEVQQFTLAEWHLSPFYHYADLLSPPIKFVKLIPISAHHVDHWNKLHTALWHSGLREHTWNCMLWQRGSDKSICIILLAIKEKMCCNKL